jgi:hypothetical protein
VSEFVEECRREWRRLGVPDPVANEMAADLTADLEEAEADGGSAEDVLGNSAFDPRRFAASWAIARGVTGSPPPEGIVVRRPPLTVVATAVVGLLALGAAFILLLARFHGSAVAVLRSGPVSGWIRIHTSGPPPIFHSFASGQPFGGPPFGAGVSLLALLLFIVGVVALGLTAAYYWSPRKGQRRRFRQRGGPPTPSWN